MVNDVENYVSVPAGATIFEEGEIGYCAYFIERGRVAITIRRAGEQVVLAERGPGEIFGEMAIIDDQPRSAAAVAREPCDLVVITGDQLSSRIERTDPVLRMCLSVVLARFRSTLAQLRQVEPTGDEPAQPKEPHQPADVADDLAMAEIRLEQDLRQALRREDFKIHYQPIVDLASGRTAGFEALIRWRHAQRGLISPMVFIPAAEASGLIVPISRWVLRQACAALSRLRAAIAPEDLVDGRLFMSVNVTGRDFTDPAFIPQIDAIIADTGVAPPDLKLEITESLLMHQPEVAVPMLEELKERGISIAIDDFGTGYSSLSYLHQFPIDTLKIDRSFVQKMRRCRRSRMIVGAIIGLARQLELPIVAEGVEDLSDAAELQRFGCTYGQGFVWSKPLPEDEALRFIHPGTCRRSPRSTEAHAAPVAVHPPARSAARTG